MGKLNLNSAQKMLLRHKKRLLEKPHQEKKLVLKKQRELVKRVHEMLSGGEGREQRNKKD